MASWMRTVGAGMGLASVVLGGCYTQKTADDELLSFVPAADAGAVHGDAAALPDAASAARCVNADPIAQLLCQLTPAGTGATTTPDLSGLLGSLGGLGNIANTLGGVLGTGGTMQNTGNPLVDLVNLAGGLANIAQLFNQLLNGQSPLTSLFNGAQRTQPTTPTLADFLKQLGIPVAGANTTITTAPTANDCAHPATPAVQFTCALQQSM